MKLVVKAPAKINLFLDILGRLDNGYHSLFMVMQAVELSDTVTVENGEKGIALTCSEPGIPCNEKNIAHKAAMAFCKKAGIEPAVRIHIEKNIPFAAGLAGGSADGAAVLVGLNRLYGEPLTEDELLEAGLSVGSDIPFCILGSTRLAQNTGGVLSKLKPLRKSFIVLSKPERGVSTQQAYADADSVRLYHPDRLRMLDACEKGDFENICRYAGNVFEQVIEVPERVELKEIMRKSGASLCQMSGSGPTVFGIFENREDAEKALEKVSGICADSFLTETCDTGAVIIG